jgi:arylsulfatase A-like enzyme
MPTSVKPSRHLLGALIFLTLTWIILQVSLLVIEATSTALVDTAVSTSLTSQILGSKIFITGILYFLTSQFFLYSIYIALLWYLTVSIGELTGLPGKITYLLGLFLFFTSITFICTANNFFVPHSFFSIYLNTTFFNGSLSNTVLLKFLFISGSILVLASLLALSNLLLSMYRNQNRLRHSIVLLLLTAALFLILHDQRAAQPIAVTQTSQQPNIIIIGIDALRPDFIGFYNHKSLTPQIDAILQSSTNFAAAYTALPRTFPSWTGILTGTYPKNNNARGNNTDFDNLVLTETLPKILQAAGYETIYSTDDTRFNNTNKLFGFDRIITPPMGINDFLIGTLNDFPLSNLIIPTPIGKILFPYNYANHGPAITYAPDNYLQMLDSALQQRSSKPIFLAVHFTVTHWPFYWFNDRDYANCSEVCRYQGGIMQSDRQLEKFLQTLRASHLLDHTILVLLSDHGVSLGLHGDRVVAAANYLGDKTNIKKLTVFKYAGVPEDSLNLQRDFGIDTSHGYGGDVLSLKQYHALLAFKGYGVDIGQAHTVTQPVLLIDIAPTVLALTHLPALPHADGISLTNYLFQQNTPLARPFFFESSFTLEEIEKEGISINKVLAKTVDLYRMDKQSGLVFLKPDAENAMSANKQYAILLNNWLLAYYPVAQHAYMELDPHTRQALFKTNNIAAFPVLVNLITGAWTTELNTPFAQNSPAKELLSQLHDFYGNAVPART